MQDSVNTTMRHVGVPSKNIRKHVKAEVHSSLGVFPTPVVVIDILTIAMKMV